MFGTTMNYIVRGFSTGIGYMKSLPKSTKENRITQVHTGFGDAIVVISNANGGNLLAQKLCPAWKKIIELSKNVDINVTVDEEKYNSFIDKSYDNESLEKISGMKIVNCYVEDEYLRLDHNKFKVVDNLPSEFITIQTEGRSKRARIDNREVLQKHINSYNLPTINMNNMEKWSLEEAAYIISKAKYHVGVDSGSTHFALTIKKKKDVRIMLNPKRLTETGKDWIKNGYSVELLT
jgi:hypothetical protein